MNPPDRAALRAEFAATGYVRVDGLAAHATAGLAREVGAILDAGGRRCDLRVAVTDGTPRTFVNAGRRELAGSRAIQALYRSAELARAIESIACEAVVPVPYVPEEFVANRLERTGDTNGWHWDDYPFALVWVLAAPPAGNGAELELVAGTLWDKTAPGIDAYVLRGPVVRRYPPAGAVYLLRSDTTMHRVTPLLADARRDVLCFAYAARDRPAPAVTHETVEMLYAGVARS